MKRKSRSKPNHRSADKAFLGAKLPLPYIKPTKKYELSASFVALDGHYISSLLFVLSFDNNVFINTGNINWKLLSINQNMHSDRK